MTSNILNQSNQMHANQPRLTMLRKVKSLRLTWEIKEYFVIQIKK